jgi:putative ABC transport system permease protein
MNLKPLFQFNLRYYRRHPLLSMLCIMGIALGVGIVVAVQLINDSALASFSSTVDFLAGRATHSIVSKYGWIEEALFTKVWNSPKVVAASPVITVMAHTIETSGEPLQFVGIDPFLDRDFRSLIPGHRDETAFQRFLVGPAPGVYIATSVAKRFRLAPGDKLTILTAGIKKEATVLGTIPSSGIPGGESLVVLDIAAAQELFGKAGHLDHIDIIARPGEQDLLAGFPEYLTLTDSTEKKTLLRSMLYSFQLNLAAMSLLALFVGVFLIYNFSMFSVLSRREDLSLLRVLGAHRGELLAAFFAESMVLGVSGSFMGILFGYVVAWLSMEKVSSTISELYFQVYPHQVQLTASVVWSGLGVGFLATIIGTGLPAIEVAGVPPALGVKRQTIEDRAHNIKGLLLALGLAFGAISIIASWASRISIFWGFVSAFAMTLAFALFTPSFLSHFTHYAGLWLRTVPGMLHVFLAARTISASLSRTSIAVAALAVALSMTIGVDTMIGSFRKSVNAWLEGALQGDVYISPATTKWAHPLPESLVQQLRNDPRVEAIERYSTYSIMVNDRPAKLRVIDAYVLRDRARFTFLQGRNGAWDRLENGEVFISESFAYRFGLRVGDPVEMSTPEGMRSFKVAAVIRDYSSDQGTIQIDRSVYEALWHDTSVQSVALFLRPGTSAGEVRGAIVALFPGLEQSLSSNTKMRSDILAIFDKTFAPTATLKGVSLLVALLGIATALMAIFIERSRDMTVLSYLGLSPRDLAKINVAQALLMGLASFLISILCGLILAWIIIESINYRSFGWSVDVYLDPGVFARTLLLTALACLASSVYPTLRIVRAGRPASLGEE